MSPVTLLLSGLSVLAFLGRSGTARARAPRGTVRVLAPTVVDGPPGWRDDDEDEDEDELVEDAEEVAEVQAALDEEDGHQVDEEDEDEDELVEDADPPQIVVPSPLASRDTPPVRATAAPVRRRATPAQSRARQAPKEAAAATRVQSSEREAARRAALLAAEEADRAERESARRAAALAAAEAQPSKPAPRARRTDPSPPAPPAPPPPSQAPAGRDYPAGYDRQRAFALAPKVRADIHRRKYDYSRKRLRAYQRAAGVAVDGVYGGGSAGALRYHTGGPPPRPLFKPTKEKLYPWAD